MEQETILNSKKVRDTLVGLIGVATIFVIVAIIGTIGSWRGSYDRSKVPEISVTGSGEATAIPNIATINFSIVEEAKTPKEAQDKVSVKMDKALTYLKGQGIDEKDIKTVGYYSNPKYEYQGVACSNNYCPPGKQTLVGYELSQTIQVKVRDTNKAGTVLGGIGGLNVQNISGIEFTVESDDAVLAQARKSAIDDAKAKADMLAKDLGVKIVRITSFNEYRDGGIYPMYAMGKGGADMASSVTPPQVPAGENKYSINVTITYEVR